MKKILLIWNFLKRIFIKKPVTITKKKRKPRVKSLWPEIESDVKLWEKVCTDYRYQISKKRMVGNVKAKEIVTNVLSSIPPWGAYFLKDHDNFEIKSCFVDEQRIDMRAFKPGSLFVVTAAEKMTGKEDEPFSDYGVTITQAYSDDELFEGSYAMDEGYLYTVKFIHWCENRGHYAGNFQIIITVDGFIKPTWKYINNNVCRKISKKRKSRMGRGGKSLPTAIPVSGWHEFGADKAAREYLAGIFTFNNDRNGYWNCVVRSQGVPPVAFPVLENDIVKVFPRHQRNGDGKIVHWTRTHKRKTKNGYTNVKVHTRGNTDWDIDGRNVRITLPGKHHDFLTELKSVSDSTNEETTDFVDSATGLTYSTIKKSVYQRLINRAFIKKEEIEIRNAA